MTLLLHTFLVGCAADSSDSAKSTGSDTGVTEDSHVVDTGDDGRFTLGEVNACDAPVDLAYGDASDGWNFVSSDFMDGDHSSGGGSAVWDIDGDGALDIVQAFQSEPVRVYHGGDGTFEPLPGLSGAGMALADIDGDGTDDLLVGGAAVTIVYVRDGALSEVETIPNPDETWTAGTRAPGVADLDSDGDLDIFVPRTEAVGGEGSQAYIIWNDGGTWRNDTELLEATASEGRAFDSLNIDYDDDGDIDVWVDNDQGNLVVPNSFWRNDGGVFTNIAEEIGANLKHNGMGGDVGDPDNDGDWDAYFSGAGDPEYLCMHDGFFALATSSAKAIPSGYSSMSWGTIWLDYDNDGWQDVLVAEGDRWAPDDPGDVFDATPSLLHNTGEAVFEDVSDSFPLDAPGSYRSAIATDFNNDGVLDLYLSEVRKPPHVLLSEGCTAANWIEVEAPLNSKVSIEAGGVRQMRMVTAESGFGAGVQRVAHFGLGDATTVDVLTVRLPSGEELSLENVDARRRVTVQ